MDTGLPRPVRLALGRASGLIDAQLAPSPVGHPLWDEWVHQFGRLGRRRKRFGFPGPASDVAQHRRTHWRSSLPGMYNGGMRRALRWTFTIASILFSGLALVMGLLEVVHLAHNQSTEHFAGIFAMQALVLAAVFAVSALAAALSGETA